MFKTFADFLKNKDIRKKLLFTLLILFIYRLGSNIPAPGVNTSVIKLSANSLLTMMSILGGGSIEQMSILSLGVGPYITASIIIELLAMDIIPALTEMAKSGKKGRQQMDRITRYLGVVMALVQGYFIVQYLDSAYGSTYELVKNPGFTSYLYISIIFTAGTMFTLWLADQITAKGIGNGTSMIIFAGIVADMPTTFRTVYETFLGENATSTLGLGGFIAYCVMYVAIIVLVVLMQLAERRIPIQYANKTTSAYGNQQSYLPIKINSAGVIPVIFAQILLTVPSTVVALTGNETAINFVNNYIVYTSTTGLLLYIILKSFYALYL